MERFSIRNWWLKKRLNSTLEKNYKLMAENNVTVEQINFLISDKKFMDDLLSVCEDLASNKRTEANQKLQEMGTTKALIALSLMSEKAKIADKK